MMKRKAMLLQAVPEKDLPEEVVVEMTVHLLDEQENTLHLPRLGVEMILSPLEDQEKTLLQKEAQMNLGVNHLTLAVVLPVPDNAENLLLAHRHTLHLPRLVVEMILSPLEDQEKTLLQKEAQMNVGVNHLTLAVPDSAKDLLLLAHLHTLLILIGPRVLRN
jgi:hypothetical protein